MRIGYKSHGVEYNSHGASRSHAVDTLQAHETAREVLKELRAALPQGPNTASSPNAAPGSTARVRPMPRN
jgi:hypothetical protein